MEDALIILLHTTSCTVEDAYHRLGLLRRFLERAYFGDGPAATPEALEAFLVNEEVPPNVARAFGAWAKQWLPTLGAETFHAMFEAVRSRIDDIPTMTLIVPVVLPVAEREAVGTWLRAHAGTGRAGGRREGEANLGLLVDVMVDARAVGGCRIVVGGRYADFSFRYFIERSQARLTQALAGVGT